MPPVEFDVWVDGAWRPFGGPSAPEPDPDRNLLVRGTDWPTPETTGLPPSYRTKTLIPVEGNSIGQIQLSTAGKVWDGYAFWGQPQFRAPGQTIINSMIYGGAPGIGDPACIKNYGTGYYHGKIESSEINPYGWYEQRGYPMMTGATYQNRFGIHGGDIELKFVRIRNVEDGINHVQAEATAGDTGLTGFNSGTGFVVPAGERFTVIDRCLFDFGAYLNGPDYQARPSAQSGGSPHGDAVQANIGGNVWITGSDLGGARVPSAYQSWPTEPSNPGRTPDFSNATLMIQQESGVFATDNPRYVKNWIVEDTLLGGGHATINMNFKNGNNLSGVTIRRVKMRQRQYGWGIIMDDGVLIEQRSGFGSYLAKGVDPAGLAATWSDVTILETGAAIPFTNN